MKTDNEIIVEQAKENGYYVEEAESHIRSNCRICNYKGVFGYIDWEKVEGIDNDFAQVVCPKCGDRK